MAASNRFCNTAVTNVVPPLNDFSDTLNLDKACKEGEQQLGLARTVRSLVALSGRPNVHDRHLHRGGTYSPSTGRDSHAVAYRPFSKRLASSLA